VRWRLVLLRASVATQAHGGGAPALFHLLLRWCDLLLLVFGSGGSRATCSGTVMKIEAILLAIYRSFSSKT
jgi:hypothetical protein